MSASARQVHNYALAESLREAGSIWRFTTAPGNHADSCTARALFEERVNAGDSGCEKMRTALFRQSK